MCLIKVFFHDRVFCLITAKDLVGDKLRITICLESRDAKRVYDLKTVNKGLIFGFIIGGKKVKYYGVGDFDARGVNNEEACACAISTRSTINEKCP